MKTIKVLIMAVFLSSVNAGAQSADAMKVAYKWAECSAGMQYLLELDPNNPFSKVMNNMSKKFMLASMVMYKSKGHTKDSIIVRMTGAISDKTDYYDAMFSIGKGLDILKKDISRCEVKQFPIVEELLKSI